MTDDWQPMDTAPRDGTEVLLYDSINGCLQGWFAQGEWSDDTPVSPREYSGAVWVIGDDLFQFEVEEFPHEAPCGPYGDGTLTHWRPLPPKPIQTKSPT